MSSSQIPTASLTYRQDGETVRVDLNRPKVIFGRSSNCDVLLSLKGVSRVHYMIERDETGWTISDLNSTNGTFVNRAPVTRQRLADGDQISLGPEGLVPVTFCFHQQWQDLPEPAARPDSVTFESDGDMPPIHASISLADGRAGSAEFDPLPGDFDPPTERRRERDRTQSIRLFSQVGRLLLSDTDLDGLLQTVLDLMFEHLPIQRGSIWLTNEATGGAAVRAKRSTVDPTGARLRISRSVVDAALESNQAVLVADTDEDSRFAGAASIDQLNIRSAMCAPLCHDGQVRGFIYVDSLSPWMAFNEQHLEVLTALAIFAAVGIALKDRAVER